MSSKLLIDDPPVMVSPRLAVAIGFNEAMVIQQVHYWLRTFETAEREYPVNQRTHYHNGRWWVYNTYGGWHTNFPWWHPRTIRRIFDNLRNPAAGSEGRSLPRGPLLLTGNYNRRSYDRTLWYTILYDEVDRLADVMDGAEFRRLMLSYNQPCGQNAQMVLPTLEPCGQNDQMDGDKLPGCSGQNDQMDKDKMARPIPETTTKTTPETTRKPIEQIKDELRLEILPDTYQQIIIPLQMFWADDYLVVTAEYQPFGLTAVAVAEARFADHIGRICGTDVVFKRPTP